MSASEAGETAEQGIKRGLTQRRLFTITAIVLALVLIALLLALFYLLAPPTALVESGPQLGLVADMVILGPGTGDDPRFDRPLAAAFAPDGRIYVADSGNNRVVVFDEEGRYVSQFGGLGVGKPAAGGVRSWEPGTMNFPIGIDVDENGDVYVADFRNDTIQVFDSEGRWLRRFPSPESVTGRGGSGQGGAGIAVTDVEVTSDRVYATDSYQVLVFDKDGELLDQYGRPGVEPGEFDRPAGIAAGEDGTVYVSDSNNNRVQAFSAELEPLWQAGAPVTSLTRRLEGPLNLPRGIGVYEDGSLIVADALEQRLVRLAPDGTVVATYGRRGVEPAQLNFPNGVDVDGDRILLTDRENDRVQVLRLVDE